MMGWCHHVDVTLQFQDVTLYYSVLVSYCIRFISQTPCTTPQRQAVTSNAAVTSQAMQSLPEPDRASFSAAALAPAILESLDIPGPQEDAIRNYVIWQQNQATSDEWTSQYAKAGDILLKQGFKLNLFYQRQLVDLLTDGGILRGIAWSFHSEIPKWLLEYRSDCDKGPVYTSETPSSSY